MLTHLLVETSKETEKWLDAHTVVTTKIGTIMLSSIIYNFDSKSTRLSQVFSFETSHAKFKQFILF